MTITHCHGCCEAHTDWIEGEIWQCRRCGCCVPAAHAWQWCWVKDRPKKVVQLMLWEA